MTVTILSLVSVFLFVSFFAQVGTNVFRRWRCDQQYREIQFKTLSSSRRIAKLAGLECQLDPRQSDTGSAAWRMMVVQEVEQESNDCKSFYLADAHGAELPSFLPGQYVTVRPALASAKQVTRCYSLSNSPHKKYWRITVKKQTPPQPAKFRSGGLSVWLHEYIGVGDCLLVGSPAGHFYLPTNLESPLVLLAAGVGVTPIVSMLRWSLEHTPNRPVRVLYQVRDENHWPFGRRLNDWQSRCRNLHVTSFFSRGTSCPQLEYADSIRNGKFGIDDIIELIGAWESSHYFFCGPDNWMASLRTALTGKGVMESQLHWESFGPGPATLDARQTDSTLQNDTFTPRQVVFSLSGATAETSASKQTLLELARSSGIEIASGCLRGNCGACKVGLLKGQVEYLEPATAEHGDHECLTCIARAASDLILEV